MCDICCQAEKKGQLRRPAQFADQFGEVSNLTAVHSFEGFRLDMSKAVTPTFFTAHNIFFGSPQFPTGHYQVRQNGYFIPPPSLPTPKHLFWYFDQIFTFLMQYVHVSDDEIA